MVGAGVLDSAVSAIDVAWRSWRSGLAGCLPRTLADKGLADECLAERECLADECLAEEGLVGSARLEVLAGSAESIIMTSESARGAVDITLRGVLDGLGEDVHEEDELEEDVLEDILEFDDEELIIYIFTGKISSYLCTFFHSLYTWPLWSV